MKFFFNDVEVSQDEYNRLCKEGAEAAEMAEKAKAQREAMPVKAPKSRKVAKMPAPTVVAEVPKKGEKTKVAAEAMARVGVQDKTGCIAAIMEALNVTKANATCYYANVLKKGYI